MSKNAGIVYKHPDGSLRYYPPAKAEGESQAPPFTAEQQAAIQSMIADALYKVLSEMLGSDERKS